jgi:hypothetical protein
MDLVKAWLDYVLQWAAYLVKLWAVYFSYCTEQPIEAPGCSFFWTVTLSAFLGTGALIALVIVWKVVSYRRKLAVALRAQEERDKVDYDAIADRRWDANKAYSAELGAAEVERRIREAVDQRRAANKPPSPIVLDK